MLKAVVATASGRGPPRSTRPGHVAFAYLVTVLLFARSGLYAERAQRPGLPRIVSSLFQVTVVALVFALVNGEQYSSYYIFYGTLVLRGRLRLGVRWVYEQVTGVLLRAAGYRRRAVLVGSGKHIEDVAHALVDEVHAPVEMLGFISLTPRPDNGLRSLGRDRGARRGARPPPRAGGDHRRPGLPAGAGRRARRPVPPARRARAHRAVDDGDPRPPGGVRARRLGPAVRAAPAGLRGLRLRRSSGRSTSSARSLLVLVLSPVLIAIALAVWLSSRGPVLYRSMRPGIGGEPFACFKFRTMRSDADQLQADLESLNEATGALFKIRARPAHDARRAASCAATRSTSCRSCSTWSPARCRSSARGRCPSATSSSSRTGTRSATSCCPGITGLWQVSGRSELDFDDLVRLDFLYLERWSVGLDLTILLKTIPAVLSRRGAF